MNKKQFFEKLESNLKGLPDKEIEDILGDFEEYFDIGKERGASEEDLLSSLDEPRVLASLFYPLFSRYLSFMVNPVAAGFAFLGLCAFGILFFVGNLYLSKLFYRQIVRYLKFNLSIIRGRWQTDET